MAFSVVSKKSGKTYYLYVREQTNKDGKTTRLYYFARDEKEGVLKALPEGYTVIENERTGLPFLKRKA
jgi:hypothetical protein